MTTASKQPHWAPRPPPCAYESLPNDQHAQDDHGCSSDHYTSSDVSECWEEKRARHFKETMFPDRRKKHKVGTHAYCKTKITLVPAASPFTDMH